MSDYTVAFIGLGIMGYPMAGHLAAAGHSVQVYNRTSAKADQWVAQHGGAAFLGMGPVESRQGLHRVHAAQLLVHVHRV